MNKPRLLRKLPANVHRDFAADMQRIESAVRRWENILVKAYGLTDGRFKTLARIAWHVDGCRNEMEEGMALEVPPDEPWKATKIASCYDPNANLISPEQMNEGWSDTLRGNPNLDIFGQGIPAQEDDPHDML